MEQKKEQNKAPKKKSTYSLPTRILAVVLTALVSSGVITYLIMFISSLFQ